MYTITGMRVVGFREKKRGWRSLGVVVAAPSRNKHLSTLR